MREIREDHLIHVEGIQESGDVRDRISLVTKGEFVCRDRAYYITYRETEATGYAGCTTTVKAQEDGERVSMLRFGPAPSQLLLERGVRHICHYETGQGALSLGLCADEIVCDLSEDGGSLRFSYLVDMGEETLSKNSVHITVRRAQAPV